MAGNGGHGACNSRILLDLNGALKRAALGFRPWHHLVFRGREIGLEMIFSSALIRIAHQDFGA